MAEVDHRILMQHAELPKVNALGDMAAIEGIKNARQQNALTQMKMDEFQQETPVRQAKQKSQMSEAELARHENDMMLNFGKLNEVMSLSDPMQREAAWDGYKDWYGQQYGEIPEQFPQDFDENIVGERLNAIDQYFSKKANFGSTSGASYGAPREAVDADGNPVFVQTDKQGNARIVEGFAPPKKMSSTMAKALDTAQNEYFAAQKRAAEAQGLAETLEANIGDFSAGKYASWKDWTKNVFGGRNIESELRTRVIGLKNAAAIQNLPPGVASDKDIELVMKGVPPDDAPPEEFIRYVNGIKNAENMVAEFNEFKSDYISNSPNSDTRGLIKAWREKTLSDLKARKNASSQNANQNIKQGVTKPQSPTVSNW